MYTAMESKVPWTRFNTSLVNFDKFRKLYSVLSAPLVGNIKTSMMNAMDAYFHATRHILDWCSLIVPLLGAHIRLFTEHSAFKAQAQNRLLQTVLTDGIERMKVSEAQLETISSNFNAIVDTLAPLFKQFQIDYDEKSKFFETKLCSTLNEKRTDAVEMCINQAMAELKARLERVTKFYHSLNDRIGRASRNIISMETGLKKQIQRFVHLKEQSVKLDSFHSISDNPEFLGSLVNTTLTLIGKCTNYGRKPESPKAE